MNTLSILTLATLLGASAGTTVAILSALMLSARVRHDAKPARETSLIAAPKQRKPRAISTLLKKVRAAWWRWRFPAPVGKRRPGGDPTNVYGRDDI